MTFLMSANLQVSPRQVQSKQREALIRCMCKVIASKIFSGEHIFIIIPSNVRLIYRDKENAQAIKVTEDITMKKINIF